MLTTLSPTESYTLNGCVVWNVNYITIKLLKIVFKKNGRLLKRDMYSRNIAWEDFLQTNSSNELGHGRSQRPLSVKNDFLGFGNDCKRKVNNLRN